MGNVVTLRVRVRVRVTLRVRAGDACARRLTSGVSTRAPPG